MEAIGIKEKNTKTLYQKVRNFDGIIENLEIGKPCVITIDGVKFKNLTKGLEKPFDQEFHNIINSISRNLSEEIPFTVLSFISGDEIVLILNPKKEVWCAGFCNKINSMISGLASYYYTTYTNLSSLSDKISKIGIFQVKTITNLTIDETIDYLIWKQDSSRKNYNQNLGTVVLKIDQRINSEKLGKEIIKRKFQFISDFNFKEQKSYLNKLLS